MGVRVGTDSVEVLRGEDVLTDTSEVRTVVEQVAADEAQAIAREWYSAAVDHIFDAGDELEWELQSIAQSGIPPQQDGDDWVFGFAHHAAHFVNDGTEPHVIEAKDADMLAFEWPDAPQEVQEMFESTFPTVFFKSVKHPGTPAVHYIEKGAGDVI